MKMIQEGKLVMKINIVIVPAIGIGIFKINGFWAFQVPFVIIVVEDK